MSINKYFKSLVTEKKEKKLTKELQNRNTVIFCAGLIKFANFK